MSAYNRTTLTGPCTGGMVVLNFNEKIAPVQVAADEVQESVAIKMPCRIFGAIWEVPAAAGTDENTNVEIKVNSTSLTGLTNGTRLFSNDGTSLTARRGDAGNTAGATLGGGQYPYHDAITRHPTAGQTIAMHTTDSDANQDVTLFTSVKVLLSPKVQYYADVAND